MKNLKLPHAIILSSIIIALSIFYYTANDPLSKCMDKVIEENRRISTFDAAKVCTGKN